MNSNSTIGRMQGKLLLLAGLTLCVFLAIGLSTVDTYAESSGQQEKVVRMGYYENDNFQAGASDDLVKTGYSYEYMRRLQAYTNWKYKYVYGEYGDLYEQLLKGKIDFLTGLAYQEARKAVLSYPDLAMGDTPYTFLKRSKSTNLTSNPNTIAGKKIGTLDGAMKGIVEEYLKTNNIQAQIVLYDDLEKRDAALLAGKVDITIVEGNGTGATEGVEAFAEAGASDYYVVVNKKRPDLLKELNLAQSALFEAKPNIKSELNEKWFRTTAATTTLSTKEQEWIQEHPTLTVGYFDNYLPFSGTDENGKVSGVLKDLMPEIFSVLKVRDVKIRYKAYPDFPALIQALQDGEVDTAFPVYANFWGSEQYDLVLTDPAITTYFNLAYKGQYPNMDKATIALREDNLLVQTFLQSLYPKAKLKLYDSVEACLDAVADGSVDGTLIGGLRTDYIIRSKSSYKTLSVSQIADNAPLGFATARNQGTTADILNHGMSLLDSDYALTHTYQYEEKHEMTPTEFLQDHLWIPLLVILLIAAIIVAFVLRELKKNKQHIDEIQAQQEELKRAKEEAEAAMQEAKVADKAKTTFLFNMSHDIRTPLNAIKGFTELAGKETEDREKTAEYRRKVMVASNQLTDILNSVLEMARIENNKVVIDEELTDAREFFDAWTSMFEGEMKSKNLTLKSSVDTQHTHLYLDKVHVTEVLMNVIGNSVKYTPNGGEIFAGIRELPGEKDGECIIETTIRDNGIGMSDAYVEQIFEEFSRERNSSQSRIQGTGLGMAIVKRLIDLMHGSIEIHSKVGEGTETVIRLPHRYGDAPAEPVRVEETETVNELENRRILMAEDIDVNALLATEILTMNGFQVERAKDGVECVDMLSKAEAGYYDLVLMDIQMPNMNGYQATYHIRSLDDERKACIPIVALSANAFKEDVEQSRMAGMNDHLAKPIDIPKMLATLAEQLKRPTPLDIKAILTENGYDPDEIENSEQGIYCTDENRRIVYWNKAAAGYTGYLEEVMKGKHCYHSGLSHVDDEGNELCNGKCPMMASMLDGEERGEHVTACCSDGNRRGMKVSTKPLYHDDKIVGAMERFDPDEVNGK